ncbi:MAG: glycosyltransferase family 2 protein [Oceanospirillales bacterium]|nr:glycosyltransferase family 2 protein [Oceanospirillales bacterium]
MTLSIIVPVLNEADHLPALLEHLARWREQGCEVVLVDGGSRDGSCDLIRQGGFSLVETGRGRARQMNAGAAIASGDMLLFLHADSRLPDDARLQIQRIDRTLESVWGRFDVEIEGRPLMLKVVSGMMNIRSRLTGIATGDQAIFVSRALFEKAKGYPDQPLMEDIELSRSLLQLCRPQCLKGPVQTSGRRWESRGVWRTILLMWQLRWAYWRGARAEQLARRYQ